MKTITLKELCKSAGVTRRTIQVYEKKEIVHAIGCSTRGYLLYSEAEIEHVKRVKLYQQSGFSLNEIKEFEKMKKSEQIKKLKLCLAELQSKVRILESYVKRLEEENK